MATTSKAVVADSGVFLALILPDTPARQGYARQLVDDADKGRVKLYIPQLCHHELASVVTRKVRSRALDSARAEAFLELVEGLTLDTVVESFSASEIFAQAMRVGCGAADVVYLALAADVGGSVATLDGGMRQGAVALKLGVYGTAP